MDSSDQASLKIVHWDARAVSGKRTLLRHILRAYHVDVALLSETLLSPSDSFTVPGFHVYRPDFLGGGRTCRGLAVLVGRRILHKLLPTPSTSTTYALGVEVLLNSDRTRLFACYKPPGLHLDISDIHVLLSEEPTVIAGNLNCKHPDWGSRTSNADGRRLQLKHVSPYLPQREEQFRSQLSTTLQLVQVTHLLSATLNKKESTAAMTWRRTAKYLGVIINRRLTMHP